MKLNTDWWKLMSKTKKVIIGVVIFIFVVFIAGRSTNEVVDVDTQVTATGADIQEDTKVDQILISDEADARGIVSANKTDFLSATTEIFVSASIKGAAKDSQASALLMHLPTGDELGPAVNGITESGDLISSFSFTKPTAGWPIGTYKVVISLSTGESNETLFNVG